MPENPDTLYPRDNCPAIFIFLGLLRGGGVYTMVHRKQGRLHTGKALAGASLGALTGWSEQQTKKAAATGAILGGVAGLLAGKEGLEAL